MPNPDVSPSVSPVSAAAVGGADLVTADVEVADSDLLLALTGPGGSRLTVYERECDVRAGLRGNVIRIEGRRAAVSLGERVLFELMRAARAGTSVADSELASSIRMLRNHPELTLAEVFLPVVLAGTDGRQITPRGLAQRHYVRSIQANDVVFGVGPAGTGKTYLAVATAVSALTSQRVERIILTRPAVEAGEKLGFLPGDMAEKVDPYLRPLYDALHDMLPAARVSALIERGTIEVAPLAFMRGRTLSDSFVILDEAQNTTVAQMRMFLTRIGLRSKAVITGDITQVDLPRGTHSGLADAVSVLSRVQGLERCYFSSSDVQRHPLVQRIVDAYEARDNSQRGPQHGNDRDGA
jgi:phosphate starvation-inducible PhoH-like protein